MQNMVAYRKPAEEGNLLDPKDKKKNGSGKERKFAASVSRTPEQPSTRRRFNFQSHSWYNALEIICIIK